MSAFPKLIDWLERRLNLSEIFSWITTFGISYAPVNPNLPIRDAVKEAFLRPMSSYERWPHMFGMLTFIAFLVEVVTGLMLAFFFQPSSGTAYESTRLIIRDTSIGWYVHQMHYWGGQALVILLFLRLARFVMHRVYRTPRQLIWIFGVIMFVLAVQSCFTGELLPWDQSSYWKTMRGMEAFATVPLLGSFLEYLGGGPGIGPFLLIRFYLLHVVFLPVVLFVFFHLHFASVRRVGLSELPQIEEKARPIFPGHLMFLMIVLLAMFGVILSLGVLFPTSFSVKADPFQTPAGVSVAWYLLPLFGFFELIPKAVAGWIALLALLFVLVLPFVDTKAEQPLRNRPIVLMVGLAALAFLLFLTYFGYRHRG